MTARYCVCGYSPDLDDEHRHDERLRRSTVRAVDALARAELQRRAEDH